MRTTQQAEAHSHARSTRESVHTTAVALADVISLLEQDDLRPGELEHAAERLRRARVALECALRDTQEHVDRVLDAIKPVVALAPCRPEVRAPRPVAERRAARRWID